MPKKIVSKAVKKAKRAKVKGWLKRVLPFQQANPPYERKVMLLDSYLRKYDDGTVDIYCSLGRMPISSKYGYCYHVTLHGEHGTPCIQKWVYCSADMSLESVWEEACNAVDAIANEEIIDTEFLKTRGFKWD